MAARISGLRDMIQLNDQECRDYMEEKGEYLAESARQLDHDRKIMLEK